MIVNAIHSKDGLMALINGAETLPQVISACEQMVTVLRLTKGLWVDLGYAYKGKDLANRCLHEVEAWQHKVPYNHRHQLDLRTMGDALRELVWEYHRLQHAREV